MQSNITIHKTVLTIVVSTILLVGFYAFAWTDPTQAPPSGNTPSLLDTSSTTQTKAGGLNVSGNLGVGTTTPGAKLDIAGETANTAGNVKYYRNVAHYSSSANPATGTMKIQMPKSWSSTMMQIRIQGFQYNSSQTSWEVIIGGYNYSETSGWYNYSVDIRGRAPFSQVRLAHDGTKNVILLGNTSAKWYYPKIEVSEFAASHSNVDGWGSGWNISVITSETGITNSVTPTVYTYLNASGNLGIGTTATGEKLTVNGDAIIRGGDIKISDQANDYFRIGHHSADWVGWIGLNTQWKSADTWDYAVPSGYGGKAAMMWMDAGAIRLRVASNAVNPIVWVEALSVREVSGNVGIGTTAPQSALHVPDGKYAQFQDNNAGAPPSLDCDNDAERGRMSIDTTNNRLYICNGAARGWDWVAMYN